ncbi:hypothetical protein GALMADRAFT_253140 [Galerina marginata CBS 339.88]|uniref:Ricin B lectin domain-containing protein n=1 Tax=Galerina marginata (strain CBS 339.88) TaxID=685588 RepID=A0A067SN33_GALM3|nr:hypothetical protein GALMADRAFT_253140 [Galerina marginata CBS 339.88]
MDSFILPPSNLKYRIENINAFQWKIVEDSLTTLPDGGGMYIIQTLKGDAIHSAPAEGDAHRCAVSQEDLGHHHVWEIQHLGNGKATIKNIRVGAFLNVQRSGLSESDWVPVLSKAAPALRWNVKKIGNFAYSITVKRPAPQHKHFVLTVENNAVALKLMNDEYNQLWFIDLIDPTHLMLHRHDLVPRLLKTDSPSRAQRNRVHKFDSSVDQSPLFHHITNSDHRQRKSIYGTGPEYFKF